MELAGQHVAVRLSPKGRRALRRMAKGKQSLHVLALDSDAVGIWAVMSERLGQAQRVPVVLLKWEHIDVVGFEVEPAAPAPPKAAIGFLERTS